MHSAYPLLAQNPDTRIVFGEEARGALARHLGVSEAAVSQHVKVLREAGLVSGERRGYFMHYQVRREALHELGAEIAALADIPREEHGANCGCRHHQEGRCRCGAKEEEEGE